MNIGKVFLYGNVALLVGGSTWSLFYWAVNAWSLCGWNYTALYMVLIVINVIIGYNIPRIINAIRGRKK